MRIRVQYRRTRQPAAPCISNGGRGDRRGQAAAAGRVREGSLVIHDRVRVEESSHSIPSVPIGEALGPQRKERWSLSAFRQDSPCLPAVNRRCLALAAELSQRRRG